MSKIPVVLQIVFGLLLLQLFLKRFSLNFVDPLFIKPIEHLLFFLHFMIHESGHIYWMFFGKTLKSLGGTLNETLIALAIAIYYLKNRYFRTASFALFFLGYNLKYVSLYMEDSISRKTSAIPMHGIHHWKYLFDKYELGSSAHVLSNVTWYLGLTTAFAGVVIYFITCSVHCANLYLTQNQNA